MAVRNKKKLGDLLKESGVLTEEQIVEALQKKKNGQKLGDALLEQGYITEQQLLEVLEIHLDIPSVSLYRYPIDKDLMQLVSKEVARRQLLIPLTQKENVITVAMNDPMDYFAIDDLELSTGFVVKPVIASKDDILQSINKYYDSNEPDEAEQEEMYDDAPAIRIMDQILQTGVHLRASDIHIDPNEVNLTIRYRVDGVLRTERTIPKRLQNSLIARTKILSNLNITETRLPQDGRIRLTVDEKPIDLRISTLPTVFGEKVVIRILDLSNIFKRLTDLDFSQDNLVQFEKLIENPAGLILLTGPTGSGKTSTLYASINKLNREDVNIITVEDPVEYQLDGINQVQVNNAVGLTFAAGLRSILRQDPNIIMVGEIRDRETAEIAVRSALTGHLVFSTLHTNSAVAAIPRLFDMEVEPYLVVSSLSGIMAQRLVKKVCKDCKQTREATLMEKTLFEKRGLKLDHIHEGAGCNSCKGTGYKGRMAIHELLVIDDKIRHMMMNNNSITDIKTYIRENGMKFLIDDGLIKVQQGLTTMEEVLRVAADD
ncbi:Flp pilus assembly complex ATPase component TadA [Aquibacillus koreensis]|uniref:Flp pilus assembly complex ATPase component TadA n=1 Tax=Aquibacillus koreensis TaxID=279446 RepID=A0A9X3WG67_9BACI|nr:ATPase, T2SS/T4P/T4SS family [Aquibacillus koreensis]MCT2537944.1 ATPase, T2SS/T4P/T4SS family [Aquibacillus koreensis]MDC3419165.1 Flp pilus assembly complex ATPase component TadA [Aquibacillus koreensis]